MGHQIRVLSLTDKPGLPINGVSVQTFSPRRFHLPMPDGRLKDALSSRLPFNLPHELLNDIVTWQPDVVHLHFVHSLQNIALASFLRHHRIPYCVTINGGLAGAAQRRRWFVKRVVAILVERHYLNEAAFLHCISEEDAAGTLKYGTRNQIVVAPNGIDVGSVPKGDNTYLTARFPVVTGKRTYLYIGRLDPQQKGLDILLRAFAAARNRETILILAGPDWRGNLRPLQTQAETLGVGQRVIFPGATFSQEKFDLLASADVFVHPSRWEAGVPFSVLEAAASGKPCLATPGSDPDGRLAAYGGGLVVPCDVRSVTAGLDHFADLTVADLKSMGQRARQLVEDEFAWERVTDRIVEAYGRYAKRA